MKSLILALAFAAFVPVYGEDTKPAIVAAAPKPFLGVTVDENAASFDPALGLPVMAVIPGSSAAALGIQAGDRLLSLNGKGLRSQPDLAAALGAVKVGDTVTIELTRKTGDKDEKKTVSGAIQERPQVRTLNRDLAALRDEVLQLRGKAEDKKSITLAEVLRQLKEIEANLPAAVADFKKQYPNGEFNISIKIDITSDKNAKQPLEVGNQPGASLKPQDADKPVEGAKPPK